jgi:hypothetical protein
VKLTTETAWIVSASTIPYTGRAQFLSNFDLDCEDVHGCILKLCVNPEEEA